MNYARARRMLPQAVVRQAYHFERTIEEAVREFSDALAAGSAVLDAGAGETQYKPFFARHRYVAVDLGVGDSGWDYTRIDVLADLTRLPFRDGVFDAAINIVTLEHLAEPGAALAEMARAMRRGAVALIVAPQEWEVHQAPHDYFRYTRYGLELLLRRAGLEPVEIAAIGGFWRLLSRRLLNAVQQSAWFMKPLSALALVPLALGAALLDPLDVRRDFTLGYRCLARKP